MAWHREGDRWIGGAGAVIDVFKQIYADMGEIPLMGVAGVGWTGCALNSLPGVHDHAVVDDQDNVV